MNLTPLEQINNLQQTPQKMQQQSQEALRRAAMQFEAILLMQLTSVLNNTGSVDGGDGEEALFGTDGGTSMAKQMFSEQLATTMSQSGGIGLADVIMQQMGGGANQTQPVSGNTKGLSGAISAVKDIRQNVSTQKVSQQDVSSLINKSAKLPVIQTETFQGDPNDAAVISTFEDILRSEGVDESDRNLMLNGKVQNSTRARIVPNKPVTEVNSVSDAASISNSTIVLNSSSTFDTSRSTADLAFQMPVSGRISSGFGNRFHPIDKRVKMHTGLDLAVPTGTKIVSTADGVVTFAGWKGSYGNLVVVSHPDGRESRYAHLSKINVTEGERVSGGQQIALSGSTGKSTGPHLHFEIRENGQFVDPRKIMSNVLPKTAER